jgi:hypothetical protein
MHTLAIDALALWFVAQTKLKMRSRFADAETVKHALGVPRLPDLSFANVRILLRQVFPLETLTNTQIPGDRLRRGVRPSTHTHQSACTRFASETALTQACHTITLDKTSSRRISSV